VSVSRDRAPSHRSEAVSVVQAEETGQGEEGPVSPPTPAVHTDTRAEDPEYASTRVESESAAVTSTTRPRGVAPAFGLVTPALRIT
jgi:hypothetical protein